MIQVTTIEFPPVEQPLALETEALAFWVPQKKWGRWDETASP